MKGYKNLVTTNKSAR